MSDAAVSARAMALGVKIVALVEDECPIEAHGALLVAIGVLVGRGVVERGFKPTIMTVKALAEGIRNVAEQLEFLGPPPPNTQVQVTLSVEPVLAAGAEEDSSN